jgi:hypothetical protein
MSNGIALSIILGFPSFTNPERTISVYPQFSGEDCPRITMECPTAVKRPDQPLTFLVHIEGRNANQKRTFRWTVSNGTIVEGQGTVSIKVKGDTVASTTTATVEIEGLDSGCQHAASCSMTAD